MTNEPVHIALASDRNYLPFAAITMASAAANSSRKLIFHFLYESLDENDFRTFDFLKKYPHVELQKHKISDAFFRDWPDMRWSKAIYYRLMIPEILPHLDRIIYLDCDLCVLGDLAELWDRDFEGRSCMAVVTKIKESHAELLGIDSRDYFNSGVLVISPSAMLKNNTIASFKKCFVEYADKLKYPDQDILNIVFKNDYLLLHPRWNIITSTYRNPPIEAYSTEEVIYALMHPGIVHFTGRHKPWMLWKSFHHPYSLAIRRYAKIAGLKGIYAKLFLKSLFFRKVVRPKKKLPWDSSVIDFSLLK
ncbi:MAG: glycosyltransferase family 8 protein [Victivallaceae bacterium]|nr:glycosyltransferase family 8 protein [Victivallaceae bacterium]MDD5664168.1 glycosyltransferase family 8 protein [Victivallaceae bacterium]